MAEGRVFLRGIDSAQYGLDAFRERQLSAPRVRGAAQELDTANAAGYSEGSSARWRLSPGDEPFLTQTISAHFSRIPAKGSTRGHGHQNEAAFYIVTGSGYEIHDGERHDWSAGDLVYVHTDSVHRHFNENAEDALAFVVKPKSMWMYFGLVQQGREKFLADGAPYGARRNWSHLWTKEVTSRRKVVHPGDTPWEDTPDGRVRRIASGDFADQRFFSLDVSLQEVQPGYSSGERWQMADELFYIASGSGHMLQWHVEAEIEDRYYARIALEPDRYDFVAGDTVYVPQNHVRQLVNTGDTPLVVLASQNRLFRNLGYDSAVMLAHAPEVPARKNSENEG
jgi:mannose-6-phosphate isomerase-like protein (cupin superfamily)